MQDILITGCMPYEFTPARTYDPDTCETVIELYSQGMSSTRVAITLGITRTIYNEWRATYPEFDRACEFGENLSECVLEDFALQGALGKIKNFNNTMMQFLIKYRCRKTYGDQKDDKDDESTLLEQLTSGKLKLVRDNER